MKINNMQLKVAWVFLLVIVMVLLLCLSNFKGCNSPKPQPIYPEDTLLKHVKTDEQINEDVISRPFLPANDRDSLFSKWERENNLSRFRGDTQ